MRLTATFILCVIATSAGAQTTGEQVRQRAAAVTAQSVEPYPSFLGALIIELGPDGPLLQSLQSFDRPFPIGGLKCAVAQQELVARPTVGAACQSVRFRYMNAGAAGNLSSLTVEVIGTGQRLPVLPTELSAPVAIQALRAAAGGDQRVDFLIRNNAGMPISGFSLSFAPAPELDRARGEGTSGKEAVIRLDRTGVASSQFLNPHWPVRIDDMDMLVFSNRLSDRQFIVTFSGIKGAERWKFLDQDLRLSDCDDDECSAVLVVSAGGERRVPRALLTEAYVANERAKVVSFSVSLFHDDMQLANPTGYFSLVPYSGLDEGRGGTKWTAGVAATYGGTPDLSGLQPPGSSTPVISEATPRGGVNDVAFRGTARLGLEQSLGSRVKGQFEIRLKEGTFGTDPSIAATKYRLDAYGYRSVTLSAGLFDIAEPSEGVALSESGENIGIHHRWFDVNHIVRKYVPRERRTTLDFKDREAEGRHAATLLRSNGITWMNGGLDLYALFGRKHTTRCVTLVDDACPAKPADQANAPPPVVFDLGQWYRTFGGEVTLTPREGWTTTGALYHSQLYLLQQSQQIYRTATARRDDTGSGTVGLISASWTNFGKHDQHPAVDPDAPARYTVRAQFGAGSSNQRNSTRNAAYLGETASYTPDVLFISLLADKIKSKRGEVGGGLANKTYVGLLFTTPRFSPLGWLARGVFQAPGGEVTGETTTVKWHDYRLRNWDGASRHAGQEVDVAFAVQSPAKATYSISLAGFWPGGALSRAAELPAGTASGAGPLLRGFQWSALIRLSVSM